MNRIIKKSNVQTFKYVSRLLKWSVKNLGTQQELGGVPYNLDVLVDKTNIFH